MSNVRVIVYTCSEYCWTLPGFAYLFQVYWSAQQPVAYAGCPKLDLPENFQWYDVESRVVERWSDGLIEFLNMIDDDLIVWLLDDYYICRGVDHQAIGSLAEYMRMYPDVLRIDLTADRLHSGHAVDIGSYGRLDIIETDWDTPYNYSTQAAMWNRKHLLSTLRPAMSPWDFELHTEHQPYLRVLGTRGWPVRYLNLVGTGLDSKYKYRAVHVREGLGGTTIERIDPEHLAKMLELGLLPEGGYYG